MSSWFNRTDTSNSWYDWRKSAPSAISKKVGEVYNWLKKAPPKKAEEVYN